MTSSSESGPASLPVPKAVSGKECPWFDYVELEQDLDHVEPQEDPLRVSNHGILLIQADEDSVHQDDEVVDNDKGAGCQTVRAEQSQLFGSFQLNV